MRTVRRLLYRDIAASVAFVAIAFLALFYFIDFVDELEDVGRRGHTVARAALAALYELPGHTYELMPIAVLIGTIYALARMAQQSEFTILRTGGLGPWRALSLLMLLGLGFAALTFVIGDFIAPVTERQGALLKATDAGGVRLPGAGAWLKEHRARDGGGRGDASVSVNVGALAADGTIRDVRIFEFDARGTLERRIEAPSARVGDDRWLLDRAVETRWPVPGGETGAVERRTLPALAWPTSLSERVVAAALLPAETMNTLELWRYSEHLARQEQAAQRPRLLFWKRAFYPLTCFVMVALALPFAYLHARSGGISLKVFGGIMLGISFVLMNNVAGHIGVLGDLTPWMVSAAPGLAYLLLSLGAFAWLVRYR